MKISIILAVLQMSLGIFLYGLNNLYKRDWLTIIFEWYGAKATELGVYQQQSLDDDFH